MSVRAEQLAQKRRDLQTQCALQRQQIAYYSANIEARLVTADRVLDIASHIARNPVALIASIAGVMILGPWRILKWVSRGAIIYKIATTVRQLIQSRDSPA